MGQIKSSPTFCAITETVADLANWRLPHWYAPPHRSDKFANTPPPNEEGEVPPHDVNASPDPCALGLCALGLCAPFKAFPSNKMLCLLRLCVLLSTLCPICQLPCPQLLSPVASLTECPLPPYHLTYPVPCY
jgi:hypothetical protein